MTTRRNGVLLNIEHLDQHLAQRAITARRLAQLAGLTEQTLSRARRGHRVKETTLAKIAGALLRIPPLEGADSLVVERGSSTDKDVSRFDRLSSEGA